MLHSILAGIALGVALVWSPSPVSSEWIVAIAASGNPLSFVEVLTEASIPAGIEIRRRDFDRFINSGPSWDWEHLDHQRLAREASPFVSRMVVAFNQAQTTYRVASIDGVLVIRPAGQQAAYLDAPPPGGTIKAHGVMRVAEKVFAPLDPMLDVPGARAGSTLGPIGGDVDPDAEQLDVAIEGGAATVLDLLNQPPPSLAGIRGWLSRRTTTLRRSTKSGSCTA